MLTERAVYFNVTHNILDNLAINYIDKSTKRLYYQSKKTN
jgi:hypothetical protein